MPTTMQDVARRSNVSVKTVSNVINGYPYIREATRQRVLAAIEELGYTVNISARNLRSGRTGTIALAVPQLKYPYFAELADAVIDAAAKVGLNVIVQQTGADRERELSLLSGVHRRLTDGVIFSPLALGDEDREAFTADFPLVLLGERIFGTGFDHVTISNVAGAKAATEHLLATGRAHIGLIGAHPGETHGTAALRQQGYESALLAAGHVVDSTRVVAASGWHRARGAEAMARMLDSGTTVDAVVALNDTLALGVLHTLHNRRIRVPQDIAVIGFDDIEEAQYSMPTLSSVHPGRAQIARVAVDLLQARVAGSKARPTHITADFEIKVRASTVG